MEKIELKHISTWLLQDKLKIYNIQLQNQEALKENDWIDNFEKLKGMYERQKQQGLNVFTDDISLEIKEVEEKLLDFNEKGYKPEIYLTNENPKIYNYKYNKDAIDKLINSDVLLYMNPLEYSAQRKKLSHYSIYELRHLLSHCEPRGKNLLRRYERGFGPYESQKLVRAINFYNLQLERQSLECDCELDDIFFANKLLKEECLEDQIKEVIQYITDIANECIWGELTDCQKKQLLHSVLSKGSHAKEMKNTLVDVFSNYTTLKEIEAGLVKTKTINRFIIK